MILMISMMMLSLLTSIGTVGVLTSSTDIRISKNERLAGKSFFIAEGGINHAQAYLATITLDAALSTNAGNLFDGPVAFGGGTYEVIATDNADGDGSVATFAPHDASRGDADGAAVDGGPCA